MSTLGKNVLDVSCHNRFQIVLGISGNPKKLTVRVAQLNHSDQAFSRFDKEVNPTDFVGKLTNRNISLRVVPYICKSSKH